MKDLKTISFSSDLKARIDQENENKRVLTKELELVKLDRNYRLNPRYAELIRAIKKLNEVLLLTYKEINQKYQQSDILDRNPKGNYDSNLEIFIYLFLI